MDEAERCHRVALMHAGRLLALDTVQALKQDLPGGVLEITCSRPAAAVHLLAETPEVLDSALFGDRIHALVTAPSCISEIERRLLSSGQAPVSIEPIQPSLEDVFIRVIGLSQAGETS
jgi:ABC-2 type transport system ATP-binding protein